MNPRVTVALTVEDAQKIGIPLDGPGITRLTTWTADEHGKPLIPDMVIIRRLCSGCVHGYLGAEGVFCRLFNELIDDETTANSCEGHEAA